jgi:hypothetical protein
VIHIPEPTRVSSARPARARPAASSTVRDLVAGAPIRLESRGTHELKGVPGSWEIFAVAG